MGLDIRQETFAAADFADFSQRLEQSYAALAELLERPGFGAGPCSIGAELELSLIDRHGRPALCNQHLMRAMRDARFTAEIDRFNIEFNSDPLAFAGDGLTRLGAQLNQAVAQLRACAAQHAVRPVMVGILPSLRATDLGPQVMTPITRYRVLNRILRQHRGRPFLLNINGADPLKMSADDVTYEGANTSFQLHLKVAPDRYVRTFNAAQMALGPVLAASGNSPIFLQHRLWEESRIVVFKQTVDDRTRRSMRAHASARVGLGTGWWEGEVAACLTEHLRAYDVLLPVCGDEDMAAVLAAGGVPKLAELCMHNGTIWHWNRPVYDAADGGHLRIEFRVLPAGPSLPDMLANAALLLGLSLGLAQDGPDCARFPFNKVEYNLYRGAQNGLQAQFLWPDAGGELRKLGARELLIDLLPLARRGLVSAGLDGAEAERHLGVVKARIESGQTGARWQHDFLTRAELKHSREEALRLMINRYEELSRTDRPVHTWPVST